MSFVEMNFSLAGILDYLFIRRLSETLSIKYYLPTKDMRSPTLSSILPDKPGTNLSASPYIFLIGTNVNGICMVVIEFKSSIPKTSMKKSMF